MSFDSIEFRNAVGTFSTGICVVTALTADSEPRGMTINSFSSVSLDPALVLWNLQNDSDCHTIFESADKFVVNILALDQQDLAVRYSTKDCHVLSAEHYRLGASGQPVLHGVVSSLECETWARYPGGDHSILVGEVKFIENNSNRTPLVFYAGQYTALR